MLTQTRPTRGQKFLTTSMALALFLQPLAPLATLHSPAYAADSPQEAQESQKRKRPNILFFIMDDVGVDQMTSFGYGGATPPRTPNINAIAKAGVRFRNTWSMPECSPSRAMFFEGRYPLRTNVRNAILALDLANSQVSPYETTTPKVLRKKGYESGLFGKFHLSGSDNNPLGNGVVHVLGWDYFAGFLDGAPHPVDTTAGGVKPIDPTTKRGPYSCGFVPNATDDPTNGANTGACFFADPSSCMDLTRTLGQPTPGRDCLTQGGIFVPNQTCQTATAPSLTQFNLQNAYYVGQLVIDNGTAATVVPFTDRRARVYRSTLESDLAIQWINQRKPNRPWMATVSYSSAHTPYQQPPTALLPLASVDTNSFNCVDEGQSRVLSNQMLESLDKELGRVMVETGLATYNQDGSLNYDPATTNTMVVIVGDNGTFAPGVKAPFDVNHAKGTPYQTGVWVPLIAAGPLVNTPDRDMPHMVNVADLFALFGEIAGVDVNKVVPKSHTLDAVSMLPYLTNPAQTSLRATNFTQTGRNLTANDQRPSPCVLESLNVCVQIFPQQQLCEFEGGTWYGPGGVAGSDGVSSCCEVKTQYLPNVQLLADSALAIRNERFKLVQQEKPNCTTGTDDTKYEFYEINEDAPLPKIDRPDGNAPNNLLTSSDLPPQGLNAEQLTNFNALYAELQTVLNSEIACPGDGNLDKKVDNKDLGQWKKFNQMGEGEPEQSSSWYDLNHDGKTDETDRDIIKQNLGTNCLKQN